jgi:hypothetical protein
MDYMLEHDLDVLLASSCCRLLCLNIMEGLSRRRDISYPMSSLVAVG